MIFCRPTLQQNDAIGFRGGCLSPHAVSLIDSNRPAPVEPESQSCVRRPGQQQQRLQDADLHFLSAD